MPGTFTIPTNSMLKRMKSSLWPPGKKWERNHTSPSRRFQKQTMKNITLHMLSFFCFSTFLRRRASPKKLVGLQAFLLEAQKKARHSQPMTEREDVMHVQIYHNLPEHIQWS